MTACITGVGLVTPVGLSREQTWQSFLNGTSGIGPIQGYACAEEVVQIAGEVDASFEQHFLDQIQLPFARRFGRFTQLALLAGQEALQHSGLDLEQEDRSRIGVAMGVGGGATHYLDPVRQAMDAGDVNLFVRSLDHYFVIKTMFNAPAGMLTIQHGLQGPSTMVSAACASGSMAVTTGLDWIRSGRADVVLVGGTDSTVNRETIQAYWKVRALTDQNQLGAAACRPFDQDRAGFVMAEGAGLMVLESEQHAAARGAKVLAKVAGAGMVSEAYKIATPQLDGVGMARAMIAALANAKLPADAISHMSAHAPSTPQGDMAEALAVHHAFGKHASKMSVTAPKSYIGHAIGASSAIQTALLALSIERSLQIPTLNLDQQDSAIDLDVVHGAPRPSKDEFAMVNAFGFGGHNVSLILGKA
ncbi:MAG: beta-ketoacyl-[acyl-carrier-protein] synthase family protein [Planctomycetes bacterium]|nr:beta-ketoacyl-[acyl-carrier-protein] synthase family protein [Planctomycetota bacterium]